MKADIRIVPNSDHTSHLQPTLRVSGAAATVLGTLSFLLLFGIGGIWATKAELAGAVVAQGTVAVEGKPKQIQHVDGGIVAEIAVEDGDHVAAGDLLIRLDDNLLRTEESILIHRLTESLALHARLSAERDGSDAITWVHPLYSDLAIGIDQGAQAGQEKLFEARRKSRIGQIDQLREQVLQLRAQLAGLDAAETTIRAQQQLLDEELVGVRSLRSQGLSPIARLMALERQREDYLGQLAQQVAERGRLLNAISEAEIKIAQIDREYHEQVLGELREVILTIHEVAERLHTTRKRLQRIDIRAPVSGILHESTAHTLGGVIRAGDTIAQIVPISRSIEIEALVEPQFIDEIHVGQATTLHFTAFNSRTTPELAGTVRLISASTVPDKFTGAPHYRVSIFVADGELNKLAGKRLTPGMPVEVFARTGQRSALSYLLKPMMDQISRAMTEE